MNRRKLSPAQKALRAAASPARKAAAERFFKTGPGQYGEGDVFVGVSMPRLRAVARDFRGLDDEGVLALLGSEVHEDRMLGLVIWTHQFSRGDEKRRKRIFDLVIRHRARINNWDLVDVSIPRLVGTYLRDKERSILRKLVRSKSLWDRRIAVLATFDFIRSLDFDDTLVLCERLLDDKEDLMHKACGWMLREVGKRDLSTLRGFLDRYSARMPRTMLRYAIERLPEKERLGYLRKSSRVFRG